MFAQQKMHKRSDWIRHAKHYIQPSEHIHAPAARGRRKLPFRSCSFRKCICLWFACVLCVRVVCACCVCCVSVCCFVCVVCCVLSVVCIVVCCILCVVLCGVCGVCCVCRFTVSLFFNACDVTTKLAPDAPPPRRDKKKLATLSPNISTCSTILNTAHGVE